jgi:hypothetical protein
MLVRTRSLPQCKGYSVFEERRQIGCGIVRPLPVGMMPLQRLISNGHAEGARSEVLLLGTCKNAAVPAEDQHGLEDFRAIWGSSDSVPYYFSFLIISPPETIRRLYSEWFVCALVYAIGSQSMVQVHPNVAAEPCSLCSDISLSPGLRFPFQFTG